MTFTIDSTADLDVLRARARDIARTYLKPLTSSERPAALNRPLIQALGDLGLLPMLFSVSNGGSAQPDSPYAAILCALREGLAMECPEASMALTLQAGASSALVQSSADEAKAHWLPLIARGEAVPAFALSEPEFGSDAGNIELSAARVDSGWALSGKKTWISNAPEADVYTIVARTTPDAGSRGVTNFLVPGDAAGLTGEALDLVKSYPTGSLRLDRVLVTEHQVLGQVDGGFKLVSATLHAARLAVAAAAIGCAQAALDDAISCRYHRNVELLRQVLGGRDRRSTGGDDDEGLLCRQRAKRLNRPGRGESVVFLYVLELESIHAAGLVLSIEVELDPFAEVTV